MTVLTWSNASCKLITVLSKVWRLKLSMLMNGTWHYDSDTKVSTQCTKQTQLLVITHYMLDLFSVNLPAAAGCDKLQQSALTSELSNVRRQNCQKLHKLLISWSQAYQQLKAVNTDQLNQSDENQCSGKCQNCSFAMLLHVPWRADKCCSLLSRRSTNDKFWPNLPSLYKLLAASPAHNVHVRFGELRHQRVIRAGDSGEAGFCRHAARKCESDFVRIKCQDDQDIPDIRWNRILQIIASPTLQSGLIYVEYERRNGRYSMSGSALILLTAHCCGSAVRLILPL